MSLMRIGSKIGRFFNAIPLMDDFVFFFLLDEYTLINKELDTSGIDHINIIQLSELLSCPKSYQTFVSI